MVTNQTNPSVTKQHLSMKEGVWKKVQYVYNDDDEYEIACVM